MRRQTGTIAREWYGIREPDYVETGILDNNAYSNIARTIRARLTAANPRASPRDREQAKRDLAADAEAVSLGDLARAGRKLRRGATVHMMGRRAGTGPGAIFRLDRA